jgi:hypothetical protein
VLIYNTLVSATERLRTAYDNGETLLPFQAYAASKTWAEEAVSVFLVFWLFPRPTRIDTTHMHVGMGLRLV